MMRTSEVVAVAFVLACAPVAVAAPNAADQVTARKLYNEGLDLRDAGKLDDALSKFTAADALVPTPKTRIELGRTQEKLGHLVAAYHAYVSVKNLSVDAGSESKYATVRLEAAKLAADVAPRLAQIKLVLTDGIPVHVDVDGTRIADGALKEPRILDPGTHEVIATYDDRPPVHSTITLAESEHVDVELAAPAKPEVVAPVAPPKPTPVIVSKPIAPVAPEHKTHWLVWTGAAVAGVAVVTGAVTGIVALNKGASLNDQCSGGCPPSLEGELHNARTWATVSTVSFGVAAASAGAMILGLTLPATKAARPAVGLGFVGVSGEF